MSQYTTFSAALAAAAVVPVVTGSAGSLALNTIPSGDVVLGILDPTMTQKLFNPFAEGQVPVTGTDTYAMWCPSPSSNPPGGVALAGTQYANDAAPWYNGDVSFGAITLYLVPGSKNMVEASSVMTFHLSPQAALIVLAGTNTF